MEEKTKQGANSPFSGTAWKQLLPSHHHQPSQSLDYPFCCINPEKQTHIWSRNYNSVNLRSAMQEKGHERAKCELCIQVISWNLYSDCLSSESQCLESHSVVSLRYCVLVIHVFASAVLGFQKHTVVPGFYMRARDLNLGPQVCIAGTLLTNHFPRVESRFSVSYTIFLFGLD